MLRLYRGPGCCYAPTVVVGDTFVAFLELDCGNSLATSDRDIFLSKVASPTDTPTLREGDIEAIKNRLSFEGYCDWLAAYNCFLSVWDRIERKWLEIDPQGRIANIPDQILEEITAYQGWF